MRACQNRDVNKTMTSVALAGALVLAACGGGSDAEPFDTDRACRVGERLVEETAAADRDGVIRQIERLDDLEGIADSGLVVDDLDSIAEALDEQSVEDLIAEFDVLDCDIEMPEVTESEPVVTEPEPVVTEAVETTTTEAAEEPPATDPVVETTPAPDTTAAPVETTPPATTPSSPGSGIPVDIGSTGAGAEIGVNGVTEDIIAQYGMVGYLFSPNTNVVELRVSRTDSSFSDDVEYTNSESITMSAATSMSIEDVRAAYRAALESLGVEFDFSESTSSDDGRETVAVEASPANFDLELGNWDVRVAQDADTPGIVLIEVDRLSTSPGPVPAIIDPARDLLQETADIGSNLGWAFTGYGHTLSVSSFDGSVFESGRVEWDVSEDNTVREAADAIQAAVGAPVDSEDADDETISWAEDNDERAFWFVNYSEFSGTTVSYSP